MTSRRSLMLVVLCAALAVAAWWPMLARPDLSLGGDWDYFNALALFTRSAVHNYGVFPLHDPWRCGGVDVLANPQTRLFNPLALGDLWWPPHLANLFWVLINLTIGGVGAFILFWRIMRSSFVVSAVLTWMFIAGGWLTEHLLVGHLPFVMLAQLPWIAVVLSRIEWRWARFGLFALPFYWVLSGGHYAVVFGLYWALTCLGFGLFGIRWQRVANALLADARFCATMVGVLALLCFARFVPVAQSAVLLASARETNDAWRWPYDVLLDPVQQGAPHRVYGRIAYASDMLPLGFYEIGCYVGLLSLAVIGLAWVWRSERPRLRGTLASLWWLWVGLGLGGAFNPWTLHRLVPLLNTVHIQPRFLFLAWLVLLTLLAAALRALPGWALLVVVPTLAAETTFVHFSAITRAARVKAPTQLITTTAFTGTAATGFALHDYYDTLGTKICYEPAMNHLIAKVTGEPGYRGEAYFEQPGGRARITEFTPEHLVLEFDSGTTDGTLQLNTNHLAGFTIKNGPPTAHLLSRTGDLVRLSGITGRGTLELRYSPWYFWPVILSYLVSLAGLLATSFYLRS